MSRRLVPAASKSTYALCSGSLIRKIELGWGSTIYEIRLLVASGRLLPSPEIQVSTGKDLLIPCGRAGLEASYRKLLATRKAASPTYKSEVLGITCLTVQQKIVMKVQMNCNKSRSKALKIAAVAHGVTSVALEGDDKDMVVVIGDEVDSVCLTISLRKKVGYTRLISVEEEKKKDEKKDENDQVLIPSASSYNPYPQLLTCEMGYNPSPSICSIM
ncbi:hypothetical protein HHK36_008944 [Tetracentron sinense]|uniref:Uncharacterized protein n=1 Tax=Tetracentron sinense TaxID=13715 RepID=A0A834ZC69_TETSI|nr:hypothetical protein HHK36_008944 [Tetracentron sinense]